MKMKFIIPTVLVFVVGVFLFGRKINQLNGQVATLKNNINAYELELQDSHQQVGVYQMTIAEIEKSKDSLVILLNETRKELGIKNKELNQALTFKSVTSETVVDTIVREFRDTVSICDFEMDIVFNSYTSVKIAVQDSLLTTSIDVWDRYQLFDYSRKEWKEPKFIKRLILFRWGKWVYDEFKLVNENELNKIKDFKVIKINTN